MKKRSENWSRPIPSIGLGRQTTTTTMMTLFKFLVLSRLDYASQLWSPRSFTKHIAQIARLRRTYVAYRWLNTGKVVRCLQRLSNQGPLLYIGAPSRGADRIRVHHLAKLISTTFFVSIHTCLMDNIFYYVSPFSVSVSISVR